jgi:cyclic pyranopterin phosphate synthase
MPKKAARTPKRKKSGKIVTQKKDDDAIGMIDISEKNESIRTALAEGTIVLKEGTVKKVRNKTIKKGDALNVASIAAIQAVKKTSDIIPLCHPIPILDVKVDFDISDDDTKITSKVFVKSIGKTGVEMEALAGVSAALLSIWDMTKYLEKDAHGQYPSTRIRDIEVIKKVKR